MALAAFAVRSGEETRQMQVVCLDDLVPAEVKSQDVVWKFAAQLVGEVRWRLRPR
jgi:hypothetical protein